MQKYLAILEMIRKHGPTVLAIIKEWQSLIKPTDPVVGAAADLTEVEFVSQAVAAGCDADEAKEFVEALR